MEIANRLMQHKLINCGVRGTSGVTNTRTKDVNSILGSQLRKELVHAIESTHASVPEHYRAGAGGEIHITKEVRSRFRRHRHEVFHRCFSQDGAEPSFGRVGTFV